MHQASDPVSTSSMQRDFKMCKAFIFNFTVHVAMNIASQEFLHIQFPHMLTQDGLSKLISWCYVDWCNLFGQCKKIGPWMLQMFKYYSSGTFFKGGLLISLFNWSRCLKKIAHWPWHINATNISCWYSWSSTSKTPCNAEISPWTPSDREPILVWNQIHYFQLMWN